MDSFTDIKVATMFYHHSDFLDESSDTKEVINGKQKKFSKESISVRQQLKNASLSNQHSIHHLKNTHRKIIDSIHQIDIASQTSIYKEIIEQRSEALLMDEDTLNFF